jgi:hypothetical protein
MADIAAIVIMATMSAAMPPQSDHSGFDLGQIAAG